MAAPYEIGSEVPAAATCFNLEELQLEKGAGPLSRQLCEELSNNHFVIVSLGASGRNAVERVWTAAQNFFELPSERKEAVAGRMRRADGNVGVIGWGTMPDDNEVSACKKTEHGTAGCTMLY